MSDPFRTPEDYELFIYSLIDQFPELILSTLTFIRVGATMARVAGELKFEKDYKLSVRERLVFDRLPLVLDAYSYEIWRGEEKLAWYDPQPHPDDRLLQATYPHHKHTPPDIKHHRTPAPGLSFSQPNLPVLIKEIIDLSAD
jgi:hypothetical protein